MSKYTSTWVVNRTIRRQDDCSFRTYRDKLPTIYIHNIIMNILSMLGPGLGHLYKNVIRVCLPHFYKTKILQADWTKESQFNLQNYHMFIHGYSGIYMYKFGKENVISNATQFIQCMIEKFRRLSRKFWKLLCPVPSGKECSYVTGWCVK